MFASPTPSFLSGLVLATSLVASTLSQAAHAQQDATEPTTEAEPDDAPVDLDDEETTPEPSSEMTSAMADEAGEEAGEKKKGDVQLLIGARYRMMVLPKGLMNMFGVDGGRTVVRHGVGGEVGGYFGKSADGFLVMGSVWWLGY